MTTEESPKCAPQLLFKTTDRRKKQYNSIRFVKIFLIGSPLGEVLPNPPRKQQKNHDKNFAIAVNEIPHD